MRQEIFDFTKSVEELIEIYRRGVTEEEFRPAHFMILLKSLASCLRVLQLKLCFE